MSPPSAIDRILAATQADLFWLPADVRRLDRAEVLAVADGGTRDLFNQVVRTSCTPDDVPALVDEIQMFHPGSSQWLVVPTTPMATLERVLPRHGYAPAFEGDAYAIPTSADWPTGPTGGVGVRQVSTLAELADNVRCCHQGFGRAPTPYDAARELAACTGPEARVARFVAYDAHGEAIGSGNINRFEAQAFGFLWAGAVVPHARGRGVYRALLAERLRWARERGLDAIGLYARRSTSGPIVARAGFGKHGPMTYWRRPPRL